MSTETKAEFEPWVLKPIYKERAWWIEDMAREAVAKVFTLRDARLIAAAPDLLHATKAVVAILETARSHDCAGWDCATCQPSVMQEILRATIKKAEGTE